MRELHEMMLKHFAEILEKGVDIPSDEQISNGIISSIPQIAEHMLRSLREDTPAMLAHERDGNAAFQARLSDRWQEGFDLLIGLGVMCREAGEMTQNAVRSELAYPSLYKFEALNRQHARACQILQEILCLLKGGFADGALGRWRSLHETATISLLLSGNEFELSKAFLEHGAVERFKRLIVHQEFAEKLDLEPFGTDNETTIRNAYALVIRKYGKAFKGDYGWASSIIKKERIHFSDIETQPSHALD